MVAELVHISRMRLLLPVVLFLRLHMLVPQSMMMMMIALQIKCRPFQFTRSDFRIDLFMKFYSRRSLTVPSRTVYQPVIALVPSLIFLMCKASDRTLVWMSPSPSHSWPHRQCESHDQSIISEEVTVRTIGVKDVDVIRDLKDVSLPEELFLSDGLRPKEYEAICEQYCPQLKGKIVVQSKRKLLRQAPMQRQEPVFLL